MRLEVGAWIPREPCSVTVKTAPILVSPVTKARIRTEAYVLMFAPHEAQFPGWYRRPSSSRTQPQASGSIGWYVVVRVVVRAIGTDNWCRQLCGYRNGRSNSRNNRRSKRMERYTRISKDWEPTPRVQSYMDTVYSLRAPTTSSPLARAMSQLTANSNSHACPFPNLRSSISQ
jgi:hypothetical protein